MSSFPTCQVCQQNFSLKGPAPFLLPCLHSLCETCVTSADGGVISCSTCQRDVNLTETRLQKDVITEKEILHLTVQQNPELVLCTHEDDGNQAVCWCKECEDFLCEHCQNVHGSFKGTKQHIVYDVAELELGNLNEDRYCSVHPKFIADTWDTDCCMLTCRKCRLGDHSGHKTVDVEEAAQTSRKAVSTLQDEIKSLVDIHETHSEGATKDLETSAKGSSILPEKISHTFHSLKTLIDQREAEVRIAHRQLQDAVTKQLQDKKNSSDINHQRCQTTSDYISKALKYSSNHDIVELRPLLEEKSKDRRSAAPSDDYTSLALPVFNTEGLEQLKCTLGKLGVITTNGAVPKQHTGSPCFVFVIFVMTAMTILLSAPMQQTSDYETQKEMLTKRLRQCSEEILMANIAGSHFEFNRTRYNADRVHINDEGELINTPQPNPPHSDHRLKKYSGTISTVPLTQSGYLQYWEVKAQVGWTTEKYKLILEIGLTREEELDQYHSIIDRQPHSYSLIVTRCASSICTWVWRPGKHFLYHHDTLEITPGTSLTLHYGVVYDNIRKRIAFLDLKNMVIVGKIDNVDSSVALWPMFGVYSGHWVTISMSLVVGHDIDMAEDKIGLIIESLS